MKIDVEFEFKRGEMVTTRGDLATSQYDGLGCRPRALTVLACVVEISRDDGVADLLYVVSYMPEHGPDSVRSIRLQLHEHELVAYPKPKGGKPGNE